MIFHTPIPLKKQSTHEINHHATLLLLGSCFSENIGKKLNYFKFQSLINPLGILFHPKAIENLIINATLHKKYTEKDIFLHNEHWHCYDAHSSLSANNKADLLNNLNNGLLHTATQIKAASHIIITLGTSWVYRHLNTNTIVANCHKVPQKKFSKEILTIEEITTSLHTIITHITSINPKSSILFTLSPIRHLKDGFIENQRSKAHLLTAIHNSIHNQKNCYYFPSYEIMMDELRDYRFYKEDMIHPNNTAINHIWEKFSATWISEESKKIMQQIDAIQKGLAHRPFNPKSEQHQQFLKKLYKKKETLQQAFPFIQF
ncbi:conserved hypothetical protein [Tenacibaculum maritimum]|uniref:GSCFA domain-containing protein n=1 Tax=Tenacibaculum maritimum TaxID=107401 RepID=UPI0012E55328|nr:GSCFA domain-containing protein [Tenacibaculum maritimum]CAA0246114.1 conserved hypothetical protein [Tenacibaculum maritimum]